MKVFLRAQFNDCSVVWVFHTRSQRNKVNRLHERCLKIIYNDKHSRFEKLLVTDNSVCMHHNNIHTPATKMCSSPNGMSLEIMNETFRLRLRDNIHHHTSQFFIVFIYSVFDSIELTLHLGHKSWEKILPKLKISNLLMVLKKEIRK